MYKIKNDLAPQIVQSIFRQGQLIRSYNLGTFVLIDLIQYIMEEQS